MSRHLGPLCVAIALAVGIALAQPLDAVGIPTVTRWFVAVACAASAVRNPPVLLGAALALGLALGTRGAPAPAAYIDDRAADHVTGTITGPVVQTPRGGGALLVADDGVAVWVWTDAVIASGDRVAVTGALRGARPSSGPALPDRADALLARGATLELTASRVDRLGRADGISARVWRWAGAAQHTWADAITTSAGGSAASRAALAGIAVGARGAIPPALDERWRRSGIYHVLSVSGLHLAVVAGLVFWLLCRLVAASPWGGRIVPARWAAPPAFAIAVAYTLVTGGQLATIRALVVVGIVLVAAILDRPVRLVDALGVAAIAILVGRPADLFDPGFQLSFVAALALALAPPATERRGVVGWLLRGLATSAWITVVTAPITAYHFQQVMPSGLVGNLVLTPPLELVALPLALAGLAIGWDVPLALAAWLVELVDLGASALGEVAIVGRVALVGPALLGLLVAMSLVLAARARRTRLDVLLWLGLCLGWTFGRTPVSAGTLRVTFVDVGQGDAAIVELPGGGVWLVDAGGHTSARDDHAAAAPGRAIERVLAAYGRARIDVAIISHPHPDHYRGLAGITLPIGALWIAHEPEPTPEGRGFLDAIAPLVARGTRIVHPGHGAFAAGAGVEVVAHGPRYGDALAADPVRTVNDNSLVIELRYRGRSILFAGDLEEEGEAVLASDGRIGRVDIVKVSHHGSRTSSTAAFVDATRPRLAVISCGLANQFGFPAPAVLARWHAAGAAIARTDLDGSVTVTVDAAGRLAVTTALRGARILPAVP